MLAHFIDEVTEALRGDIPEVSQQHVWWSQDSTQEPGAGGLALPWDDPLMLAGKGRHRPPVQPTALRGP